ncbi:hypothetical protein NUW54_g5684 [Trametes sanguinea]|uniref:Uncharacterized protein n=1 Tax=Trametes sanguinea TaxID=158606 RepID=A0ACC1PUG6_9APHY|nr:hypothetical protein NUW54_g5684 [Trametes sanguinea]
MVRRCPARLLDVWRPDTLLPHLREVVFAGQVDFWVRITDEEFNTLELGWLNKLFPFLRRIARHSPLEILRIEDICWLALSPKILNVDFRKSNQLLRTLNAHPQVLYHMLSQISRTEPLFLRGPNLPRGHTGLFLDWLLGQRDTLVIERLRIASKSFRFLECSGLEPTEGPVYQREDRCGPVQIKEREPWNKRSRASGVDGEGNDDEGEDVDSQEVYPKTAHIPREIPPEYLEDFHDPSSVVDYQSEEDEAGKRDMDLSYVFPPWSWSDDYGYANLAAELT